MHDLTRWAKGLRAAGAGRQLRRPAPPRPVPAARPGADGRRRAHRRSGPRRRPRLGRRWTEELAGFADATGRPWALATVAYGRALTADPGEAEALFQEALSHHARRRSPLDEARTHLAYGEWLRRSQRRVDARQHLRHALETFHDLRAAALAARANQELRASGETARKRDPSTLVKLTPMELKIAQLVSSGPVQQGRRRPVLGLAAHRRLPPAQRLRQGRGHLPRRARPARPRLSRSSTWRIPAI